MLTTYYTTVSSSAHLPNLLTMAPTQRDPIMPPTLKMATEKLHTMMLVCSLNDSPYRWSDTFWKNLRSFCSVKESEWHIQTTQDWLSDTGGRCGVLHDCPASLNEARHTDNVTSHTFLTQQSNGENIKIKVFEKGRKWFKDEFCSWIVCLALFISHISHTHDLPPPHIHTDLLWCVDDSSVVAKLQWANDSCWDREEKVGGHLLLWLLKQDGEKKGNNHHLNIEQLGVYVQ